MPDETELQYIWRLGSAKDSGILDMTWQELADLCNREFRGDEEEWTESAYRKKYTLAKAFYDEVFSKTGDAFPYTDTIADQRRELERLKIQYRDERAAWQKQNSIEARVDQKLGYLERCVREMGQRNYPSGIPPAENVPDGRDLIVCLSDFHIGQQFSSCMGKYDSDIAKLRLDQYLAKVLDIALRHDVNAVHVMCLGDMISGSIHKAIQVTNRENVIDQIKLSAEYITDFCYRLTRQCRWVNFYSVPGNHSRIDRKEDALKDERLDDLVAWFVGNSLKHVENFKDLSQVRLDTTIGYAVIEGKHYVLVHGDLDAMSAGAVGDISLMLGMVPDYIITAHRHTAKMAEINGVTVYQSGSLAGAGDEYAIQHRMGGKPSQLALVCGKDGVECAYNVVLTK